MTDLILDIINPVTQGSLGIAGSYRHINQVFQLGQRCGFSPCRSAQIVTASHSKEPIEIIVNHDNGKVELVFDGTSGVCNFKITFSDKSMGVSSQYIFDGPQTGHCTYDPRLQGVFSNILERTLKSIDDLLKYNWGSNGYNTPDFVNIVYPLFNSFLNGDLANSPSVFLPLRAIDPPPAPSAAGWVVSSSSGATGFQTPNVVMSTLNEEMKDSITDTFKTSCFGKHEWVDTGMKWSFCKKCNKDGQMGNNGGYEAK